MIRLSANKIKLDAIEEADFPIIQRWYQDRDFLSHLEGVAAYPHDSARLKKEFKTEYQSEHPFAIRRLEDERLVGFITLSEINWTMKSAWLALAIGDPADRGQGYAKEALALMIEWAFLELNLHRLNLSVFAYNEAAIQLYEAMGFVREGCAREAIHRWGQHYDQYLYGLLSREWFARKEQGHE
ncbi:GNAT family protein [Anaerolineales bacterium]